jgi:uncharacterized membrane protein YoaK (UPF0700 family)
VSPPPRRLVVRHEATGLSLGARDKVRAAVLSGVAGFVDAAGLLSLATIFPAHITGELVTEAVSLSTGSPATGAHLLMLPSFVVAVALAATLARVERRAGRTPTPVLLLLITAALLLFAATGVAPYLFPSVSRPLLGHMSTCSAVAAMGFQNALMRESLHGSAPTTFMTGNLTQLVIELVDHVFAFGKKPGIMGDVERSVSRARLRTAAVALGAFLSSAALGAVLTRSVGAIAALVPGALVGVLSWQAFRERQLRAAPVEHVSPTMGMRRPTPIQRPLFTQPRAQSGTRFKAVRAVLSDEPKKTGEESV